MKKIGEILSPKEAMELAIAEAKQGLGFVAPNPPVGCVILDSQGRLISTGYHKKCGQAHGEIDAINNLKNKEQLRDAQLFVTLEPCAHEGRTPSCAKQLAQLPLQSVTFGMEDPNPLVQGQGVQILKNGSIKVNPFTELSTEIEELSEIYLFNVRHKKPFVALKVASTLDGKLALKDGQSQWITGKQSLNEAHFLRGCFDGLLVGRKTLTTDDPSLNVRHSDFEGKKNKVILLDPQGKSLKRLSNSKVLKAHSPNEIILVTSSQTKQRQAEVIKTLAIESIDVNLTSEGIFELNELLEKLFQLEIYSIMVEGGAQTLSCFLQHRAFQKLYLFMAPSILGSKNGLSWAEDLMTPSLGEALKLKNLRHKPLGEDILLSATII